MEEFIVQLPKRTVELVQCHHSDMLKETVQLAKEHLMTYQRQMTPTPLFNFHLFLPTLPNSSPMEMGVISPEKSPHAQTFSKTPSPPMSVSSSLQIGDSSYTGVGLKPRPVPGQVLELWPA